ncbi:unnamed protein product [Cuscuta campestris]|uniref:TPX2 C-terminal domain-containing protein n=1 Tax=Cuscuta campestris TaxID=132261 RepID=A0A484N7K1_9ASTE|nr:unnamed protein product [Cuscuta campestris]
MADSACLIQAFSYASATPNEAKQGNAIHALGESISFGRFMSDSLAWEKWSAFAHNSNKYVEEAESYARPGSVAQKKAFFEAHYKRIAAKKAAAAAAAALALEQANACAAAGGDEEERRTKDESDVRAGDEAQETASCSEEVSETPQMERPLLKSCSKKKEVEEEEEEEVSSAPVITKKSPALCSLKMQIHGNARNKVPPPPPPLVAAVRPTTIQTPPNNKENITTATPKRIPPAVVKSCSPSLSLNAAKPKPPSKPLSSLLNLTPLPAKEPPPPPRCAPKKCSTPLLGMMTPMQQEKPVNPASASRSTKTSAPKWHLLTSVCAKSLTACRNKLRSPYTNTSLTPTPFRLRTEERATARRKQKLEEKFNANKVEEVEVQKVQLQTKMKEKAGTELRRKLGQSLCFKARPLPRFYHHKDDTTRRGEEVPPPPQPPAAKRQQSPKKPGATLQPSAQPLARKRKSGVHKNHDDTSSEHGL